MDGRAGLRFVLLRGAGGATAADHSLMLSFVAAVSAAVPCAWICAVAAPRAEPAARLAALSHMLMNGFFFNQGRDMSFLCEGCDAPSVAEAAHRGAAIVHRGVQTVVRGMRIVNTVPASSEDSTLIEPPWASTISRTMNRPRPRLVLERSCMSELAFGA